MLFERLNIVVCIKQVPITPNMKIDPISNNLIREEMPGILNPIDKMGVEESLRLCEKYGGEVTVISMGPIQAKEAIFECLAMGADKGILLCDKVFAGADTIATAYTLSNQIKKMKFDIIICGKMSMDAETGHIGPHLAEFLNIPQICYVKKMDFEGRKIIAYKESDNGIDVVEASLPVLCTITQDINKPRMPSLKDLICSKRKKIEIVNSVQLGGNINYYGAKGSPTFVRKVFLPKTRKPEMIFKGNSKEVVEDFITVLLNKKIIVGN